MEGHQYKPGDKIDLTQFNRKTESRTPKTEELLANLETIVEETNEYAKTKFEINNLLNKDGSISMDGFGKKNGGPYEEAEIEKDKKEVEEIEASFARVENETNPETRKKLIEAWSKDKLKQKSSKVEILITSLLHRVLKDSFIVTRTAPIDDYKEGVDYIMVNPETGETICAFDGVAENDSKENEFLVKNTEKKKKKTEKIILKGGANIKYGIELVDGKLTRKEISNMPVFYLGISDKDFDTLMLAKNKGVGTPVTQDELNIFSKFIQSLEEQRLNLLELDLPKNSPIYKKLLSFEKTIDILKTTLSKKSTG